MSKYEYYVEEYSQDSRNYEIKCDWQLTKSQITELYQEVGIPERGQKQEVELRLQDYFAWIPKRYLAVVTFTGVDFGDDAQVNIQGDIKYIEDTYRYGDTKETR